MALNSGCYPIGLAMDNRHHNPAKAAVMLAELVAPFIGQLDTCLCFRVWLSRQVLQRWGGRLPYYLPCANEKRHGICLDADQDRRRFIELSEGRGPKFPITKIGKFF